jgi:hypothetical protein
MPPGAALPIRRREADHIVVASHHQHQWIRVGIGNVEDHAFAAVIDVIDLGGAPMRVRCCGSKVLLEHVERIVFADTIGRAPHAVGALKILAVEGGKKALERLLLWPRAEVQVGASAYDADGQDTENDSLDPASTALLADSVGVQITRHLLRLTSPDRLYRKRRPPDR